ncbi:hypothetical protein D3C76_238960 [compost metagenome]|jgi:uncharacterized membrane protein YphA (DoxX/SURF4 family)|uniref:DoxX family protein n=1 Tax=Pseudomonas fluorescens TaxID=294 RepID=UPI000F9BB9E9|nr:DoxX family protein [Pseudomonas fluorescens]
MTSAAIHSPAKQPLRIALWVAQALLAFAFVGAGLFKLTTPIADLSQTMHWTGEYPVWFVRGIALIDLAGGLGILLPALTRIKPRLTVFAALGCTVLQGLAIAFHVSRGEASLIPLNLFLLALSLLVLWGRARRVPIFSRG